MEGFAIAFSMLIMIVILMIANKWILPRLGFGDNKSSRAVLCFIAIAGGIVLHEKLLIWFS